MLITQILQVRFDIGVSPPLGFENLACCRLVDAVWEAVVERGPFNVMSTNGTLCHSLSLHVRHVTLKNVCNLIEVKPAFTLSLFQVRQERDSCQ